MTVYVYRWRWWYPAHHPGVSYKRTTGRFTPGKKAAMHEIIEQAPVNKTANYAIALRWILSHIILLSPGFVMFIWMLLLRPILHLLVWPYL